MALNLNHFFLLWPPAYKYNYLLGQVGVGQMSPQATDRWGGTHLSFYIVTDLKDIFLHKLPCRITLRRILYIKYIYHLEAKINGLQKGRGCHGPSLKDDESLGGTRALSSRRRRRTNGCLLSSSRISSRYLGRFVPTYEEKKKIMHILFPLTIA